MNGSRIVVLLELRNENIDVIPWTNNLQLLIQRALNPAKITNMKINDDETRVEVF